MNIVASFPTERDTPNPTAPGTRKLLRPFSQFVAYFGPFSLNKFDVVLRVGYIFDEKSSGICLLDYKLASVLLDVFKSITIRTRVVCFLKFCFVLPLQIYELMKKIYVNTYTSNL